MQGRPVDPYAGPASPRPSPAQASVPEGAPALPPRISWGAVFAGAVVALAISIMLNALGVGVGGTTVDATAHATPSAASFGIGAGLWLLAANLIGLAIGGYVAARLSGTADGTDGTLHGLAVWGVAALLAVALLGNATVGLVSSAAGGISSLAGGVARGIGSVAATAGQEAADRADAGTISTAAQALVQRARDALDAGGDPAQMTPDQRKAEIGRLVTRRVTEGQLPDPDRNRLNRLVAAEYGISQQDAQARVQQVEQQIQQALSQAEQRARQVADAAAHSASIAGFVGFATLLLGAIAAALGARRGTRDVLVARAM